MIKTVQLGTVGRLSAALIVVCLFLFVTSCLDYSPSRTGPKAGGSAAGAATERAYHAGEIWKVSKEWEFTVNSVRATRFRAKVAEGYRSAKQVLIVTYSYTNIRAKGGKPLAFSKANFYMTPLRRFTFADGSHYTVHVPGMDRDLLVGPGKSVEHATWPYAFYDIEAAVVKFHVAAYDSHRKPHGAVFIVPVLPEPVAK